MKNERQNEQGYRGGSCWLPCHEERKNEGYDHYSREKKDFGRAFHGVLSACSFLSVWLLLWR